MEKPNSIPKSSELLAGSLPENVATILPQNYNYMVSEIRQLPNYITPEGFLIDQFEINFFVNVDNIEGARQWFSEYEETSKTTMRETKYFKSKGKSMTSNNVPQSNDKTQETERPDVNPTDLEPNSAFFELFLETIKRNYKNCGPNLQTALEKFAERYNAAKAKSVPALVSFLYDINRDIDPFARVKSGTKIRVQVESVKHRRTSNNDKENIDQHIIPARKVKAKGKKAHNI
ncbi:18004_t:CDS:2, partial [Racocetra persica]